MPASTLYTARIFRLPGQWLAKLGEWSILTWLWVLFPSIPVRVEEPRYRVLVRHTGSGEEIGVRMASSRKQADRALAEVEAILRRSSASEARGLLGLQA